MRPKPKKAVKLEGVLATLTPEEMELFGDGARQLYGFEYTHREEEKAPSLFKLQPKKHRKPKRTPAGHGQ
jgi:hypothetical protein